MTDNYSIEPKPLFPTLCWKSKIDNCESINKQILDHSYKLKDINPNLSLRSADKGWQSELNVHKNPEMKNFLNFFIPFKNKVSNELTEEENYKLEMSTMWININPPGGSNNIHLHPGANYSGVYVVKKPKDSGDLLLYDPRVQSFAMAEPKNKARRNWVRFNMGNGEILLFPGWLTHSVTRNESKEDRVTISFNLFWQKNS
ncbi:MAG: hypothetical protein CFH21_00337 [Alphaproteobacteria bacterium MarineAlpha5_Bin11]|nr:hypothetical protein [Pelagibacteraceae bacterium]PPR44447.1 MAG: hypothetical protein CFH21_00337 [Alphaproteobacteria bacterium MarineAlpha5_Bin11]PPR51885.1 MAG: hypothetical protein CFH20_00304 [Alphaproteobacteria bacterium MarineAlpha5_Bin10]|tara:strand:+ start:739 stop:1341 length:603 start_codon:yes stop_codon:yes gene_type:complete